MKHSTANYNSVFYFPFLCFLFWIMYLKLHFEWDGVCSRMLRTLRYVRYVPRLWSGCHVRATDDDTQNGRRSRSVSRDRKILPCFMYVHCPTARLRQINPWESTLLQPPAPSRCRKHVTIPTRGSIRLPPTVSHLP